jgi:chromosome segregation ATPase
VPKLVVTKELVFKEANALAEVGEEPSIITIKDRIGGGSYTTVKRFLDQWKAEQAALEPRAALPEPLVTHGTELLQRVWAVAQKLVNQQISELRAEHEQDTKAIRAQLAQAEQMITRLEAELSTQQEQNNTLIEQQSTVQQELDAVRTTVQVRDAQLDEQRARLSEAQQSLELRRAELVEAQAAALQQARLEGEIAALRQQLDEQRALIERLSSAKGNTGA